jgi:uncharacterized membrane protein
MSKRRRNDEPVEWNFFSFPVAFAFALGMFIAVLLYPLGFLVFIISLFFTAFGVAHIINRQLRRRGLDRQRRRDEEDERERRVLAARAANQRNEAEASPRRSRRRRPRRPAPRNDSAD